MQERRLGSRYVMTELLGRGAMGQVYRARVEPMDDAREVAVKVLRDDLGTDADQIHRFLQEGRLLKAVDHPNVVRIRDLVAEADQLAIVMDLVADGDLRHAVQMPCPEEQAVRIAAGIASGLSAVHAAGITHRDLKPENILLDRGLDGLARVRISDFGISRLESATSTRTQGMTGTVGYIAPEIAQGESATPASDVYALGVILYELCVGHGPFRAEHPLAIIRAHAEDPVPRPPDMSEPLWELVEDLLAKAPADRPTADDAARRLHEVATALSPDGSTAPDGWFLLGDAAAIAAPRQHTPTAPATIAGAVAAATIIAGDSAPATLGVDVQPSGDAAPSPGEAAPSPAGDSAPSSAGVSAPPPAAGPVVPPGRGAMPPIPPPPPRRRSRRATPVLVGAAALLLVGGTAWVSVSSTALQSDRAVAIGTAADADDATGPDAVTTTAPTTTAATTASTPATAAAASTAPQSSASGRNAPAIRPVAAQKTVTRTSVRTSVRTAVVPVANGAPAPVTTAVTATKTVTDATTRTVTSSEAPKPAAAPAPAADPRAGTVALHRYYNGTNSDHFYTTNWAELGAGRSGYSYEGVAAYVYPGKVAGTVPLHRYYNGTIGDHFYTTKWSELGAGRSGYTYEGVAGYLYPGQTAGTVPLHRYYNGTNGDHFYTTNWAELGAGRAGYSYEGVAGYTR